MRAAAILSLGLLSLLLVVLTNRVDAQVFRDSRGNRVDLFGDPVPEPEQELTKDHGCKLDSMLCVVPNCGNGSVRCLSGFGLDRFYDGDRRLQKDFDRIVNRLHNNIDAVLRDQWATALDQLKQQYDSGDIAFWVVAENLTDQPRTAQFYIVVADSPLSTKLTDGFENYPDDEWLARHRSVIWDALKQNGGRLERHTIELQGHEVRLQGMSPPRIKAARANAYYAIGLFGGGAINKFSVDKADLLSLGAIRRCVDCQSLTLRGD